MSLSISVKIAKNLQILNKLKSLQNLLTKSIAESKCNHYSRIAGKLHNTQKVLINDS